MGVAGVPLGRLGQIALTVRELERSKTFYRETLGLPFLFDAGRMAFFQCGEVRLMLGLAENETQPVSAGTVLYFRVDDLEGAVSGLEAKGVAFTQPAHLVAKMPDHALWMAFLKDPDGNTVGLMSEVPAAG